MSGAGSGRQEAMDAVVDTYRWPPRIPRGGPHHVCGVALCSVWHLAPLWI